MRLDVLNPRVPGGDGQCVLVELWIMPGARHRPHVGNQGHRMGLKQVEEIRERSGGMAHGQNQRWIMCRHFGAVRPVRLPRAAWF